MFGVAARASFFSRAATTSSIDQPGKRLIGLLFEPFRAVGGPNRKQLFQVDGGGSAMRLGGLDGYGAFLGNFKVETHDRLIDRSDLLNVKGAVA